MDMLVALQVHKSKLFLAQKHKKIFLCVKGIEKTEKNLKKFWNFFYLVLSTISLESHE